MNSEVTFVVLVLNAALTLFLTGVIWVVQTAHYPLFGFLDDQRFPEAHAFHTSRIIPVVAPAMMVELVSALLLAISPPNGVPQPITLAGLVLVAIIWLSTFFIQVPVHTRLARRRSPADVRRLVLSNWTRTVAWSARSVLMVSALLLWAGRL